jgi:hypothetical protein
MWTCAFGFIKLRNSVAKHLPEKRNPCGFQCIAAWRKRCGACTRAAAGKDGNIRGGALFVGTSMVGMGSNCGRLNTSGEGNAEDSPDVGALA